VVKSIHLVIKAVAGTRPTAARPSTKTLTQVRLTSVIHARHHRKYMDFHLDQLFHRHFQSQVGLDTMGLLMLVRRSVISLLSSCLPTFGITDS